MHAKTQSESLAQAWKPNGINNAQSILKPRIAICCIASVCTFLTTGVTAKPIDLAPKFVKGQKVRYISVSHIQHTVQVELVDIDERVNVRTETGMTLTVRDIDSNGVAELAWVVTYISLKADGKIPGIDDAIDYDSRKSSASTSASPLAAMFDRLVEQPAYLRVDAGGNILEFRGPPAPTASAGSTKTGPLDALVSSFFSREAFTQLPFFITNRAKRPAKIRSAWKRKLEIQMPLGVGALDLTQNFTFDRISPRQKTAHLHMDGDIRKAPAKSVNVNAPGMANPASALVVESGKIEGQYLWDFATGQLQVAETHLELTTSLTTMLGPMKLSQNMNTAIRRISEARKPAAAGSYEKTRHHAPKARIGEGR